MNNIDNYIYLLKKAMKSLMDIDLYSNESIIAKNRRINQYRLNEGYDYLDILLERLENERRTKNANK